MDRKSKTKKGLNKSNPILGSQEDTAEVLDFLEAMEVKPKQNTLESVELSAQLEKDEFNYLKNTIEDEKESRVKDVPPIPVQDDFDTKPYSDMFSALVSDIGKVEVSQLEKDLFMKSILNDSPYTTVSEVLCNKLYVTVSSRTMYTDKLIFDSLNKDEADKKVIGLDGLIQRLQMYVAAIQVKGYGKKNTDLTVNSNDTFEVNYNKLQEHLAKFYNDTPVHIWAALVLAVRIHEYKSKICMDNLHNENFWESAGIN